MWIVVTLLVLTVVAFVAKAVRGAATGPGRFEGMTSEEIRAIIDAERAERDHPPHVWGR